MISYIFLSIAILLPVGEAAADCDVRDQRHSSRILPLLWEFLDMGFQSGLQRIYKSSGLLTYATQKKAHNSITAKERLTGKLLCSSYRRSYEKINVSWNLIKIRGWIKKVLKSVKIFIHPLSPANTRETANDSHP